MRVLQEDLEVPALMGACAPPACPFPDILILIHQDTRFLTLESLGYLY